MTHWLVIGSSPSWIRYREIQADTVVVISGAIMRIQHPDIFVSRDKESFRRHANWISDGLRNGMKAVTDEYLMPQLEHYGPRPAWWDQVEILKIQPLPRPPSPAFERRKGPRGPVSFLGLLFVKGRYTHTSYSGPLAVQYAINNGATRVTIVGCEGYGMHLDSEQAIILGRMAEACPEVEFKFHGTLKWGCEGEALRQLQGNTCRFDTLNVDMIP